MGLNIYFYDGVGEGAKEIEIESHLQITHNLNTIVWQQEVKSSLSANGVAGGSKVSVEKLFRVKGD